jgi:DNA-binding SARP family transcriptional activator/tetratricopeptide (TPR) repeat protein
VEFGVLGPLRVNGGNVVLAGKVRVLLAALLLQANRVVPVDVLVDALWDDAPPSSARTTLQGYVKQLRQVLGPAVAERIVTRPPGYLIEVRPGELDLGSFTGLSDRGRAAARVGDWERASALLTEALALWRGEPLADVPSAVLERTDALRLGELRMQAVESRAEADLRLGRHGELVAELRGLAGGEPLREGLHGQLMLALYRCGRQADALAVFRGIDRRLRDELGVCAGPELRHLHQRMLAADPSLAAGLPPAANAPTPTAGEAPSGSAALADGPAARSPVVPAQLPADTVDFTGREEEVKLLCDLLAAPSDPERPGAVAISAVAGMGGIGKTALAVHAGHRLRDRFPDGQLYVSLRSATSPLGPSEVLALFLRGLGELDAAIPAGEEERAARYRSLLAGRRMLIVADDARDAVQVRPLLPGSAGCAVIVTSRGVLAGLAGAAQLSLGVLGEEEARRLFAAIVGAPRAAAEPEATAAVLACCAGLPLAIRIAGARLASRPGWSIARLAARLAGERDRLAELAAGDLAVRASFAVSYDVLAADGSGALAFPGLAGPGSADPARVFRLLGLPSMAELSLPAVAALAGQPPGQVAAALETLTDAHLLESPAPDRYRLHDLLRSYAAELARRTESREEQDAAIGRILHWYAGQAVAAAQLLTPADALTVVIPAQAVPPTTMTDTAEALGWYEAELANLGDAASQAASRGLDAVAAQIPIAMLRFFQLTSYTEACLAMSESGVRGARRLAGDAALGSALMGLGWAYNRSGRPDDAGRCIAEVLGIRRRAGDRVGETMALNYQGVILSAQGRFEEALGCLRAALEILEEVGGQRSVVAGKVLNNIGDALRRLNRCDEALAHAERSLAIHQEIGDSFGASVAETTLAETYLGMGRYEDAVRHCQRAMPAQDDTARESLARASDLCCLGGALAALGRVGEARDAWRAALPILERLGDPRAAEVRARLAVAGRGVTAA